MLSRIYTALLSTMPYTATLAAAFNPPANFRGVFVGSGSDGMSDPRITDAILQLSPNKVPSEMNVLYLGTATYDLPMFRIRQTQCFADRGCNIDSLNVALDTGNDDPPASLSLIDQADVIVVGGGNTLYAIDRWTKMIGMIDKLREAMGRGAILTGGSAGAICWFDAGHSDSMDPETYKQPMLEKFGGTPNNIATAEDESSSLGEGEDVKNWQYIRVPGLGFLPGLMCPHHDRVQSNGVLRASDFDQMMLRHPGELGIGLDHWAALVVNGEEYQVLSLEGKVGSIPEEGSQPPNVFCGNGEGVPGVWIKEVIEGEVHATVCPQAGKVKDLFRVASNIVEDIDALERCRRANPS